MEPTQLNWIANFIWGIADDVLRVSLNDPETNNPDLIQALIDGYRRSNPVCGTGEAIAGTDLFRSAA